MLSFCKRYVRGIDYSRNRGDCSVIVRFIVGAVVLIIAVIIGVVIVLTVIVLVIITGCISVVIIVVVVSWCADVLDAFIGIIFTGVIIARIIFT